MGDSDFVSPTGPVDLLDPLTTTQWEQCCTLEPKDIKYLPSELLADEKYLEGVFLNSKLYLGISNARRGPTGSLFVFSTDLKSWRRLRPLPCVFFGLSTYRSQLVLVGGLDLESKRPTNKVWVSDDGVTPWQALLPPMQTKRCSPTVANTGDPEYLVVAGGSAREVEVLVGQQWVSIVPLPSVARAVNNTLHNGNLYFTASLPGPSNWVVYCRLQALVNACANPGAITDPFGLWKLLPTSYNFGGFFDEASYTIASFGKHLILTREIDDGPTVHVYCATTKSWVHVGYLADAFMLERSKLFKVFPTTRELAVIGMNDNKIAVMKGSVKVPPYHPDSKIDISTLYRLEAAGFQMMTSLAETLITEELLDPVGRALAEVDHKWPLQTPQQCAEARVGTVISWWLDAEGIETWAALLDYLFDVLDNEEEMLEKIECFLNCPRCLKELCSAVIMSSLLEQRSLEPDQLQDLLPDYIPAAIKTSLTNTHKALAVPSIQE